MIPFGRLRTCSGLISGTTSGTSGSIRNAAELSTATAPRAAAIGAHCADTSSGTSNIATSTPSNASSVIACTVSSAPRTTIVFPAERGEASSLRKRGEEGGGDAGVRAHPRADQRHLPDMIVEEQALETHLLLYLLERGHRGRPVALGQRERDVGAAGALGRHVLHDHVEVG